MDDFIILDENQEELLKVASKVDQFLKENLHLCLCKEKTILQRTEGGIDFLGYFVKPTHTLVRQSVVKRFKNKLRENIDDEGFLPVSCIPMIKSYLGHFGHADTFRLKKHLAGEN